MEGESISSTETVPEADAAAPVAAAPEPLAAAEPDDSPSFFFLLAAALREHTDIVLMGNASVPTSGSSPHRQASLAHVRSSSCMHAMEPNSSAGKLRDST